MNSPPFNRFLIVGSGGREYAIIKALHRTSSKKLYLSCVGTHFNPGISNSVDHYQVIPDLRDSVTIVSVAVKQEIDLVIIGPEGPLEAGLVDQLEYMGVAAMGPTRNLALVETSKIFARQLMTDSEKLGSYCPIWRPLNIDQLESKETFEKYIPINTLLFLLNN